MTVSKNIGSIDRVIRGIAGLWMVMDGLKHKGSPGHNLKVIAGGALIANAVTGHCAMLSAFGASTIPGKEDNVINQLKATLPGQGVKPILSQDVKPKKELEPFNSDEPMKESLSVG